MEEVKPKTRIRASMPRSKNGCLTCKIRRVKCDEERPTCARCSKTGRKCDGYDPATTSSPLFKFKNSSSEPRYESPLSSFTLARPAQPSSSEGAASPPRRDAVCMKYLAYSDPCKESDSLCINCAKNMSAPLDSVIRYAKKNLSYLASPEVFKTARFPTPHDIPFQAPGTETERRLLHYFCVEAAPDLCGYSSSNFWNNLVLPSCSYEPAVRHATLALSAFHREYVQGGNTDPDHAVMKFHALREYNTAIHHLQRYLAKDGFSSEQTVLVCCALFYCIEVAREDYSTALRHIKSGLVILKEWEKREADHPVTTNMNSGPAEYLSDLIEVFSRLDMQVRIFENGQAPYLLLTSSEERNGLVHCVPAAFNDLRSTLVAMDKLTNWVFHSLAANIQSSSDSEGATQVERLLQGRVLQVELDRWSSNFEVFMQKNRWELNGSKVEKYTVVMATLLHRGTSLLYSLYVSDTSQSSVEIDEQLNNILLMAEAMMPSGRGDEKHHPRSFTFETGFVAILWLIATNCHTTEMRTRAIALLKTWPRREGIWDGPKVADILENVQGTRESIQQGQKSIDATAFGSSSSRGFDNANDMLHACLLKNPWTAG